MNLQNMQKRGHACNLIVAKNIFESPYFSLQSYLVFPVGHFRSFSPDE